MKELKYTVRFITPAFLGNAEQKAQRRMPEYCTCGLYAQHNRRS